MGLNRSEVKCRVEADIVAQREARTVRRHNQLDLNATLSVWMLSEKTIRTLQQRTRSALPARIALKSKLSRFVLASVAAMPS